ncbi:MAG: hypothetical protein EOP40_13740 [Rubrivivax sp.]|nr:MAG: hypothetical protein EOP40_13740 [Rubrivivax sp.]
MPTLAYPDDLKKSFWDKKKGALDGATDLQDRLKALQKQHEAVDWAKLADGWSKGLTELDKLTAVYQPIDKLYRAKVAPLRLEAAQLAMAADKAGKAKEAGKPLKDAAVAISRAGTNFAKAVAAGLDDLEAEFAQASQALLKAKKNAKSDEAQGEDDEPASALIDPKRLLKQLQLCKNDAQRLVNFAYLDDGKQDPVLVLHPRMAGRALMAKLVKDLGIKTGSFGMLSLDGTVLRLVVEKKYGGLVKRIRIPIKACGFKLGKVLLVDEKGQTLDQDEDQEADQPTSGGATAKPAEPGSAPGGEAAAKAALDGPLQAWATARQEAITVLKDVAGQIAELKDPESGQAVVQISAVVKNLTAEPRTSAQVAQLARYLGNDDVVADVSDLANDIRTPLLKALSQLHRALVTP